MMGLRTKLIYLIVPLALTGIAFLIVGYVGSDNDTRLKGMGGHFSTVSLDAPGDLNFAGEAVPMENFEVRERLDNQLVKNVYFHSSMIMILKRSSRYEKEIMGILQKEGIPTDFYYLLIAESALTNAVSPAGARGFWQFMEETGRNYGLVINASVDERLDYLKSTYAACKYLKDAYRKFNNWTLVAASYNMGIGGIESQLARQKVSNYYDLYLNAETSAYVFRVLSLKTIMRNPRAYGFQLREDQYYKPIRSKRIKVTQSIEDLVTWSQEQGSNYKMVKVLNPWILGDRLPVESGQVFYISVPVDGAEFQVQEFTPRGDSTVADTTHHAADTLTVSPTPVKKGN